MKLQVDCYWSKIIVERRILQLRKHIKFLFLKCRFKFTWGLQPSGGSCWALASEVPSSWMGMWPPLQGTVKERERYAYKYQLSCAPPAEQGESFCGVLASGQSMKTMARPHAWDELVQPLLHQWLVLGRIACAPFATFNSEDFLDFQLQGRRLQSLVTRPNWAFCHVDNKKHSWI